MESATHPHPRPWNSTRLRERLRALPLPRPELAMLLALAAVLYLWGLSRNGWANDYYSAAVHSMAGSWHDFLYGSFDAQGLMTVDKPPLALWVEALSAKAFGFNSAAILVPQALMGVASVGLLYDLTRRRWGRAAGTLAGLALALTPVMVAISRHNNPDALLVLCSVAALWCFVRALERGATRWLVLAGVCVGLGFEAKMGAALMVVPGMALAWLWVAPRGRLAAVRQLAWAGAAMVAVALAWPVLVWLTPASSRPWISGTSDNSIWSLIWEYNGLGRIEGQTGGPSSFGGGGPFGGATGALRLLNESLGGQAGWLLGVAAVGGAGIAALSRLRRADPRTGWIIAVGGSFAVTAIAFSFAGGIFHPYYTSLLAPFTAALVGATLGQVQAGDGDRRAARAAGPGAPAVGGRLGSGAGAEDRPSRAAAPITRALGALAIGAGAIVELVVIDNSATDLGRLVVPLVLVAIAAVGALLFADGLGRRIGGRRAPAVRAARIRLAALACGFGILLVGPAIWSVDTLGHPTSGTFPAGGPESASMMGGPGGGGFGGAAGPSGTAGRPSIGGSASGGPPALPGAEAGGRRGLGGSASGSELLGGEGEASSGAVAALFGGEGGESSSGVVGELLGGEGEASSGAVGELFGEGGESSSGRVGEPFGEGGSPSAGNGGAPSIGGAGGMFGGEDLTAVLAYTEAHGGGTIAVDSQSGAAASIIESGAEVAGIGGFSGKESAVSAGWLEERIESGAIRWIYTSGLGASGGGPGGGFGGDTRTGSESAIDTVIGSCTKVTGVEGSGALYRCGGS
ncbi:MAG: glycosyltransferase family 39 protein [Actinobacteria bacterium]|nr:glycosyltransferase family 39 protein [Actinomycetota bacterium]